MVCSYTVVCSSSAIKGPKLHKSSLYISPDAVEPDSHLVYALCKSHRSSWGPLPSRHPLFLRIPVPFATCDVCRPTLDACLVWVLTRPQIGVSADQAVEQSYSWLCRERLSSRATQGGQLCRGQGREGDGISQRGQEREILIGKAGQTKVRKMEM